MVQGGEIDDAGKLTTHPFAHPSQEADAWGGFIIPLFPIGARIAQGIVAGGLLDAMPDGRTTWVRVRPEGLAVAELPGPPTLASLLDDRPEARWWPVYVRLYGDTATLRNLLEAVAEEYIPPVVGQEADP